MGYSATGGPNGLGIFNNTPMTVSDLQQLVALIALMGNSRIGLASARDALSGAALYEGLQWYETDTNKLWVYDGASWALVINPGASPFAVASGQVTLTGMTTGTTKTASVTFPASRFSVAPIVQVTADSGAPDNVRVSKSSVASTGFTIAGNRADSGTSLTIDWVAIQMTATTAAG